MNGKYIQLLITIIIPILLISGPILYMSTDIDFFNKEIEKSDVIDRLHVDKETAKSIANNVVLYFKNKEDINPGIVGSTAATHMEDVKSLRSLSLYIFYGLTVLVILLLITLILISNKMIPKSIFLGAMLTIGLTVVIFLLITFAFNSFWAGLHRIIFTNSLWQLDPSQDALVAVFSGRFFTDFLTKSIIISTVLSAILMVIGIALEFIRPKEKQDQVSWQFEKKEKQGKDKEDRSQQDFQW
ncbi:MAG: DUF1461 domain-containing protein [Nanoarchaeota archaeon]|nr:DUF1461 domain-containing protein [Nanoarchaeota archaeon]